jgi:hypothetical protein
MRQQGQHDPDGLDEEEVQSMAAFADASDEEICRAADLGDPAAYEIFHGWPEARRRVAIREVDAGAEG